MQNKLEIDNIKIRMSKYDEILSELKTQATTTSVVTKALEDAVKELTKALSPLAIAVAKLEERNNSDDRFKAFVIGTLAFIVPTIFTVIGWLIITHK